MSTFLRFRTPKQESLNEVLTSVLMIARRLRFARRQPAVKCDSGARPLPKMPRSARAIRELRPKIPGGRVGPINNRIAPVRVPKLLRKSCNRFRPPLCKRSNRVLCKRVSVFKKPKISRPQCVEPGHRPSSATSIVSMPSVSVVRPSYVRRAVYMARKAGGVENPPALQDGRDCPSMGTIFPPPLKKLKCPWQAALLFRDAPGFFRYAERCRVEPGVLEACFRPAIGKRCATSKPQALASGFVSAFVLFAVEKQAQYYGVDTLFVLVEFFTKLRLRGPTVPGVARWALKVYEEILSLVLPLYRPAVAAVTSRDRSAVPKPVKQAPMLDFQLI